MESKESFDHSESYSFMIFGNNPLLNDTEETTRVQETSSFHNEFPLKACPNKLHQSQKTTVPLCQSQENNTNNALNTCNNDGCNAQNASSKSLPHFPLPHKSSPSFCTGEFSEPSQDSMKSNASQMVSPDHHSNHKQTSSLTLLPSIKDCNAAMKSIAHPLDFNLGNSNTEMCDSKNNYNRFEPNHQVSSAERFKTSNTMISRYHDCQNETLSFPEINLSNVKCSSFDNCEEPDCSSENPFQNILSEGSNANYVNTGQYLNEPSNNFEKTMYLFDKSKDHVPVESIVEANRVQDHLLTNNPLVSEENKDLDKGKKSLSMYNFNTTSALNSATHNMNFRDTSKCQNVTLFEEGSLVKGKSSMCCLNNIIEAHSRGESENAIQDTSDIYEHIISNQCNVKTNVYSNEDNSRDGLANLNIEHLNDNSLSNIEINEKLSEDLLNKETNLNLYTTNLAGFMDGNNQFNEAPVSIEGTIMNMCDSLRVVNGLDIINNQANDVGVSKRGENISDEFECNESYVFQKKIPEVTNILVQKLPIENPDEKNSIQETARVNLNENHAISTDTADLDTSDLSNIVLNNGIFNLDTKDQSIQKIKETYNIEEDHSVLMIENPVDTFGEQIFQVQSERDIHHTNKSAKEHYNEPKKGILDHLKLLPSNSIKKTHSNEVLKCENQMIQDNELHGIGDISEHFNTKQVELEINDLYHNESDFIHTINSPERVSNDKQDLSDANELFETNTSTKESVNDTKFSPKIKAFQYTGQNNNIVQQQNNGHSRPKKIKKTVDSNKKKIKTKVCKDQVSSDTSHSYVSKDNLRLNNNSDKTISLSMGVTNDLKTCINHCKPENTIDIVHHTDFRLEQNQLLRSNEISERLESPLKLKFTTTNTLTEFVAPSHDIDIKRKITDQSQELMVDDPPVKKIKYENIDHKTVNVITEKLPAECSVNDLTEKAHKTVKSNKEQALNKLKLILITNKDVNLNNELISLNEEEVLQNSPIINEPNEKTMNIDNPSKSLIDSSKLMDEENETMMGSQMLENIEMFGNLSEYFNIDQNNDLNQELNNEEDVLITTSLSLKSTEVENCNNTSTYVKGESKQSNTAKPNVIKNKRRNSCKEKVSKTDSYEKKPKVIPVCNKMNSQEILKVPVQKKSKVSRMLENVELFSNLSEFFNVDKSSELNEEFKREENVYYTNSMSIKSPKTQDLSKMLSNFKGEDDQSTYPTNKIQKKRRSSCKEKVSKIEDDQKNSMMPDSEINSSQILKIPVKRKNSTSKLLKNMTVDSTKETDDISKTNENKRAKKPKMTKKIFCKSSMNTIKSSNNTISPLADDLIKENVKIRIHPPLEACDRKLNSGYNRSVVHKTENFVGVDTMTNAISETPINDKTELKNLVDKKIKSVISRSRSNSIDSIHADNKKKPILKTLLPLIQYDNSLDLCSKSVENVNQSELTPIKVDSNEEFRSQNQNNISKPSKQTKPKIEILNSTRDGKVKMSKPKKAKTTTSQPPVKDLKPLATQFSVELKKESAKVKEFFNDQVSLDASDNIEKQTHKDIECQTDEQIEEQIIMLNKLPLSIDPINELIANDNSLYKSVTQKYMFSNKPQSIPFPETNISFSSCKILPNTNRHMDDYGFKSINAGKNSPNSSLSSPSSTLMDSSKGVKSIELKSADDKFEDKTIQNRIDTRYDVLNRLLLNTPKQETDGCFGKAIFAEEQQTHNVNQLTEVEKHIITGQNSFGKKSYIPDTIECFKSVKEVATKKLIMKKEPKYIMMNLNGTEKVYKLIDDKPLLNGISSLSSTSKLSKDFFPTVVDFSIRSQNEKKLENINFMHQENHKVNCANEKESSEKFCTKSKHLSCIVPRENVTREEINFKSNPNKIISETGNILQPFEKFFHVENIQTKEITSETPKAISRNHQIKSIVDKIKEFKNEVNKVTNNHKDDDSPRNKVEIENNSKSVSKDSNTAISTIEIKKGVPINLRPLPLSKNLNPPTKKIIRMVPLYANKVKSVGSMKNSLEDHRKDITNNRFLPLKEVTSTLEKVSSQNVANIGSKFVQVQNNSGVKTLLINNTKNEQNLSKSILETNKLILDILHKNKIKTIIIGRKNKEIARKELSNIESSRIENQIRSKNQTFFGLNNSDEKSVLKTDLSKKNFKIVRSINETEEKLKDKTHAKSIVIDVPENALDIHLTELPQKDKRLEKIYPIQKNCDQNKKLVDIPKITGQLIQLTASDTQLERDVTNVDQAVKDGTIEDSNNRSTTRQNKETTKKKKKTGEFTKAIENLDTLCDVIKIYKCKLCTFTSKKKNGFVHHLKSAHNRTLVVNTDDYAVDTSDAAEYNVEDDMDEPEDVQTDNVETEGLKSWLADPICDFKPFRCKLNACGVKLGSETSLNIHSACHLNKGFRCYETSCGGRFSQWCACTNHMHKEHGIDCDLMYCPVPSCDYVCNTRNRLTRHLQAHSCEKQFECEECGKRFLQKNQVANHRLVHEKKTRAKPEGDRWYDSKQCHLCLGTYADVKCLKKHIREVHKRLKPFQCSVCGFSTGRKASLQLHVRQHTREKPYACSVCPFRTGDHNTLRKHVQTHMPTRKYQCTFAPCSFSTRERYRLEQHALAKHKPRNLNIDPDTMKLVTVELDDDDAYDSELFDLDEENSEDVYIEFLPPSNAKTDVT